MDGDDFFIFSLVILFVFCLTFTTFGLLYSANYESINNEVLDEVCKELYNDTEASYHQSFGIQDYFPCKIDIDKGNNTYRISIINNNHGG